MCAYFHRNDRLTLFCERSLAAEVVLTGLSSAVIGLLACRPASERASEQASRLAG